MINANGGAPRSPDDRPAQKEADSADPWYIGVISPGLIERPIDFLFAEHQRQRQAANILQHISGGGFDKKGVKKLVEFLETDFAIHVADEELSFFPLLKQHCLPEDKIEDIIARFAGDHKKDEATVARMIDILKGLLAGTPLSQDDSGALRRFSEHVLQHLALENAVLLPIARARLDTAALGVLSGMMKERRNPK